MFKRDYVNIKNDFDHFKITPKHIHDFSFGSKIWATGSTIST